MNLSRELKRMERLLSSGRSEFTIRELPKGAFFKRIIGGKPTRGVYMKGDYDRATKRYECCKADDFCDTIYLPPTARVFISFEY